MDVQQGTLEQSHVQNFCLFSSSFFLSEVLLAGLVTKHSVDVQCR